MVEKTRPRIGEWVKMWVAADFADELMAAANCTVDSESLADFFTGTGTSTGVRWTVVAEVEAGGGGEVERLSPSLATSFGGGARAVVFLTAGAFEGAIAFFSMVEACCSGVIHLVIYINTVVVTRIDRLAIVYWII